MGQSLSDKQLEDFKAGKYLFLKDDNVDYLDKRLLDVRGSNRQDRQLFLKHLVSKFTANNIEIEVENSESFPV